MPAAKKKKTTRRRRRSSAKPKVQIVRVSNPGHKKKHRPRRRRTSNPMNLGAVGTALKAAAVGIASGWLLTKADEMVSTEGGHYAVSVGGTALGALVATYSPLYGAAVITPAVAALASQLFEKTKKEVVQGAKEALFGKSDSANVQKGLASYEYEPVYMPSEIGDSYRLDAVEASIGAVEADLGGWETLDGVSDGFLGELDERQAMLRSAFY